MFVLARWRARMLQECHNKLLEGQTTIKFGLIKIM